MFLYEIFSRGMLTNRSQNFCLWMSGSSIALYFMKINLIPLRFTAVVILSRDTFNWRNKAFKTFQKMILLIITLIEELNRGVTPDFRRCPKQLKNLGVKGSVREKLNPILTVTNFSSTDFFVCFCCNVMYEWVVLNLIKLFMI